MNCLFDVHLIKDDKKKKTHKNLYKQRLHVKKIIKKVFKFNQIIFIIYYRNKQRLHVKKNLKKFLNSIKLFLLFSTEMSRMFSTEMS